MGVKIYLALTRPTDSELQYYRPGDVVTGFCVIQLENELDLSDLDISLRGLVFTLHKNGISQEPNYSQEVILYIKYNLGSDYPRVLTPGKHRIDFDFPLPSSELPGSVKGEFGHIRYWIKTKIKTPFFLIDKTKEIKIKIHSPAFYPIHELMQSFIKTSQTTIGFFNKKLIKMNCFIKYFGYNIGTFLPIECNIDNQSNKSLGLKATLIRIIDYKTEIWRQKYNNIMSTKGYTIPPKSQHKVVVTLLIPNSSMITQNCCRILRIKYYVKITLDISFSHHLNCEFPVVITDEVLPFN